MNRSRQNKSARGQASANARTAGAPARSTVISRPGATIRVERIELTQEEQNSLIIDTRLSDIDDPKEMGKAA